MPTLYQQFSYEFEPEKSSCTLADLDLQEPKIRSSNKSSSSASQISSPTLRAQQSVSQVSPLEKATMHHYDESLGSSERDCREGFGLQQHEREQHLHQLQSINMLLDLHSPSSQSSFASSKFSFEPASTVNSGSACVDDTSIADLFGLALPRGPLMNAGQKDKRGQTGNYDASAYHNFYQQKENARNYYSNQSIMELPSSPTSVNTPESPHSVGSYYSNTNSISSKNSSPYTTGSTTSTNFTKPSSFSPARSPPYGRAIRGSSTSYSSPAADMSPHNFFYNGSRSDSPADSSNSTGSVDGPLADMMTYLSINSRERNCYPPYPATLLAKEKHVHNNGNNRTVVPPELYEALCMQTTRCNQRHAPQQQQHYHQRHTPQQHHQQSIGQHHHHHSSYNHQSQNQLYSHSRNRNVYSNRAYDNSKSVVSFNNQLALYQQSLDQAAKFHRKAAATSQPLFSWSGVLPPKTQRPIGYSSKVFLGGVPYDVTESVLCHAFRQFGQIQVEWPHPIKPMGFCHVIFESEKHVKALLANCTHSIEKGENVYHYKITSKRIKGKAVQVIFWGLDDANYVKSPSQKLDPELTVFVGALHGMITALGLATIMNDLFGGVVYAGIDTDKNKYPIGAARLTFSNKESYERAINAGFIEVKTEDFKKTLQCDPYIDDSPCSSCYVQQGPYFCKEKVCFRYYCHTCWHYVHSRESGISFHEPMSRGSKNVSVNTCLALI
ncbi:cytoplasmic polyadenylation element-binding protein [Copidosoma floridanum]|uniref:cytoplasmic polyadenylation element-binding protein n=1 Tax=Copidosoma floridanum TaxID=29053 RepID=UPI0006C9CF7A|nr:cytoplasmic polyadenylation element-binding protein [Copidosoma floridanum]